MTKRDELQKVTVAKLREHAEFLKHNVATWQLLARAADEIERLQKIVATHGEQAPAAREE